MIDGSIKTLQNNTLSFIQTNQGYLDEFLDRKDINILGITN